MLKYGMAWAWAVPLALAALPGLAQDDHGDLAEQVDVHVAADHALADDGSHGQGAHGHGHELGHGNATAGLESMTEVRTDLAIYTFVVFLALAALLGWLAWPKISEALLEREKRIEGAIADAAAKHEEAKRLLAEHEAKLATAAGEVRALLEEARRDAEATKAQIVTEARAAAKAEHARAQRDIEVALDAATRHLAEQSANLAVELAGKAIRESINPAKQQELVREALAKLSAAAPSKN
ncbi:MAG TPA: hypothetical protein PKC18_04015 [Lacipirellulaceae bacterium]|nr:hypothetical protein [Lacipirellulaceae bacterium]HMP06597.1 hypothetical protein [Lacipirellulaceae bacterium]